MIKRRNVSIQPRGLIVENGATHLDSCYYRTALRISQSDRNTYSFSFPCFFSSFLYFFLPFFFIFKRKRYSYVISAWEKRRFVSSTRVHPRPPFLSVPLQSPLNPSSNWKRNCNPGPRIHGLPVSSLMLCSTADTLYRAYANIFALNDASNPRRAAPLTRINFWTKGIPREKDIRGRYFRFERIWIRLVWIRRLNLFNHYCISKLFWFFRILDILE